MIERQRDEGVEKSVRESEIGEEKINRDGVVNDEERVNGSQEKGEMHTAAVFSLSEFADRQTVFVHRILPDSAFAQCLSFSFHALRLYAQDKVLPPPCFHVLL